MPKKFAGENSKAVAAKARKAAAQEEQVQRKQKQIEDEYWKDDDKNAAKKQARKVKYPKLLFCFGILQVKQNFRHLVK